jgi:hypothetical protein
MSKNPSHANIPLIASRRGLEQHKATKKTDGLSKFIPAKILIINRRKICCYLVGTVYRHFISSLLLLCILGSGVGRENSVQYRIWKDFLKNYLHMLTKEIRCHNQWTVFFCKSCAPIINFVNDYSTNYLRLLVLKRSFDKKHLGRWFFKAIIQRVFSPFQVIILQNASQPLILGRPINNISSCAYLKCKLLMDNL